MPESNVKEEPQTKLHFNLTREPCVPVVRGAKPDVVTLIEALCTAHELRTVRDPQPPVECGLVRFLVTLILDILQPRDSLDWEEVWEAGRFDEAAVQAYFAQHGHRFDLFDETHPLLQNADADGEDKPLAGLIPSQPAGTNAAHFHHGDEDDFAVSPATAFRLLTAIAPFMTAGGAGLSPSINGAPPWYVLLQGKNLFETIWLNCPVLADILPRGEETRPAWRDDRTIRKEDRTAEPGLLEALTWRPRRIRLVPRAAAGYCDLSGQPTQILVSRMKFSPAWSTRFEWRDPHVAYRLSDEKATVLRPREGREVWRDVGALALLRESGVAERPGIISQFAHLYKGPLKGTELSIAIYGMRTDMKMKVFEWQKEILKLPVKLVMEGFFHGTLMTEMKLAEDVAYALGRAIKTTYPRDGAGNDKAFEPLIARTRSAFWHHLRPAFTEDPQSLLYQLAPVNPEEENAGQAAVAAWRDRLTAIAWRVLDEAVGELDTDGAAMKRQMQARREFQGRLWALLHPVEAAERKKAKKKGEAA